MAELRVRHLPELRRTDRGTAVWRICQAIREADGTEAGVTQKQKAARFDEIVKRTQWSLKYHSEKRDSSGTDGIGRLMASDHDSRACAYADVLIHAGQLAECPCRTHHHIREEEQRTIIAKVEPFGAQRCQQIGEQQ